MPVSPQLTITPARLRLAAGIRVTASLSSLTILGLPRHVAGLEDLLRLLLAVIFWECFRACIQGVDPSKRIGLLLLFLSGVLSVGSLQIFSASVQEQTATALLFAFATAGVAVWLHRRGEPFAAWCADFLSLWTIGFTSFLLLTASWIWQPLVLSGAIAAALTAPLLLDQYTDAEHRVQGTRIYAALTWLAPFVVAGLTVLQALPVLYAATLVYLPLTHPIHTTLQSHQEEPIAFGSLYSAAFLFPVLLALVTALLSIL